MIAHGGRLIALGARFPDAPRPLIDLSTGISPISYPIGPLPADCFRRLPEPEQEEGLRCLAAVTYGAPDSRHVALLPGSQMAISLLPTLLRCARAVILSPCYTEHESAWFSAGAEITRAETIEELADTAGAETVLVLCNPNNPDGRRLGDAPLRFLAERCRQRNAWLVVDEAYADLEPDLFGSASLLAGNDRVMVLRSFGKSFGLAGLRLGFLLAAPRLVERLASCLGPWAVSGPALLAGSAALADRDWRDRVSPLLHAASKRLAHLLGAKGLRSLGGTALFRLVATDEAAAVRDRLGRAGILVRDFALYPDRLRFGLPPDEEAWARLAVAL